ncbi:MAG: hypothetical protein LAT64_13035 [Phycisphaerales bacterium]|nr:hypothetical protein [Planctomycetota bacterium]MCH8509679.1 hypothetical protein [Phycisphaerales bacterium]
MATTWTILAWTLTAGGGVLLLWALLWDRAKGRTRCRKCWYDLSESGNPPLRCPECGKPHRTARETRRTRRRWKWAVVGLLSCLISLHIFGARLGAYQRGWVAAVPDPILVASVAWMPAAPGSRVQGHSSAAPDFHFIISEELIRRSPNLGPTTRWLLIRIGRLSSHETITDRTTMKGFVLWRTISTLYERERLTDRQARWARSVAWATIITRDDWPMDATPHGYLLTRTLIGPRYRVRLHRTPGVYEPVSGWYGYPETPDRISNLSHPDQIHDWFASDLLRPVKDDHWPGWNDNVVPLAIDLFGGHAPERSVIVIFETSNPHDPWFDPNYEFATITVPVTIHQNPHAMPEIRTEPEVGTLLESSLKARLEPRPVRFEGGDWRPVIYLIWDGPPQSERITFGGQTSVLLKRSGGEERILMSGQGCWFRTEPSTQRVIPRGQHLGPDSAWSGALIKDTSAFLPEPRPGDRIFVRFEQEENLRHRSVFADLDSDRVFLGQIEIPLEGWTLEEINRLRISGVWPDHAMRE